MLLACFGLPRPMLTLWQSCQDGIVTVVVDHCCFGGRRKKRTALWSNGPALCSLGQLCKPELWHQRAPWGRLFARLSVLPRDLPSMLDLTGTG